MNTTRPVDQKKKNAGEESGNDSDDSFEILNAVTPQTKKNQDSTPKTRQRIRKLPPKATSSDGDDDDDVFAPTNDIRRGKRQQQVIDSSDEDAGPVLQHDAGSSDEDSYVDLVLNTQGRKTC